MSKAFLSSNFEIQMDLKIKDIWSPNLEQLCVDLEVLVKKKCELSSQHKWYALPNLEKEDMILFNAWNSIPDGYDQLKNTRLLFFPIHANNFSQV